MKKIIALIIACLVSMPSCYGMTKSMRERIEVSPLTTIFFQNESGYNLDVTISFNEPDPDDPSKKKNKEIVRTLASNANIALYDINKAAWKSLQYEYAGETRKGIDRFEIDLSKLDAKFNVITFFYQRGSWLSYSEIGYKISTNFDDIKSLGFDITKPLDEQWYKIFPALEMRTPVLKGYGAYALSWVKSGEKFKGLPPSIFNQLRDKETIARYILGLTQTPTQDELNNALQHLKLQWDENSKELIEKYGADNLEKIKNVINVAVDVIVSKLYATFFNKANKTVYLAYYSMQDDGNATKIRKGPVEIEHDSSYPIDVSAGKFSAQRKAFVSNNKADLLDLLDPNQIKALSSIDPDESYPIVRYFTATRTFYITTSSDGKLTILTGTAYGDEEVNKKEKEVTEYKPVKETVDVIKDITLLEDENEYIATRTEKIIKLKFAELLNRKIEDDYLPSMGLIFTGGGYRAMVETLGYLRGAQKTGIYDCASYMNGLSGSTWALSGFVYSGKTLDDYCTYIKKAISDETRSRIFIPLMNENEAIYYKIAYRLQQKFDQPAGWIGTYGASIAAEVLPGLKGKPEAEKELARLSDLQENLKKDHSYPLPMFVAIHKEATKRTWFEFSPFYVGTHEFNVWIKTKYLGRYFQGGISNESAPEEPLPYLMGMWGSAVAVSWNDIYDAASDSYTFDLLTRATQIATLPVTLAKTAAAEIAAAALPQAHYSYLSNLVPIPDRHSRAVPAQIPNFFYQYGDHPGGDERTITLVDGGFDAFKYPDPDNRSIEINALHNFASVPALSRKLNMLILCDSRQKNDHPDAHLRASARRAEMLTLKFPKISEDDYKSLKDVPVKLISDLDPENPIIVYMLCKKNDAYDPNFDPGTAAFTDTSNFKYTEAEFNKLSGLAEFIFIQSKPTIIEGMKKALRNKLIPKNYKKAEQMLFTAADEGNVDAIKGYIKNNVNPNKQNFKGDTALHLAVQSSSENAQAVIEELLKYETLNPNIQNNDGDTALHVVSKKGDQDIVKQLLQHRQVDKTIKNKDEFTYDDILMPEDRSKQTMTEFEQKLGAMDSQIEKAKLAWDKLYMALTNETERAGKYVENKASYDEIKTRVRTFKKQFDPLYSLIKKIQKLKETIKSKDKNEEIAQQSAGHKRTLTQKKNELERLDQLITRSYELLERGRVEEIVKEKLTDAQTRFKQLQQDLQDKVNQAEQKLREANVTLEGAQAEAKAQKQTSISLQTQIQNLTDEIAKGPANVAELQSQLDALTQAKIIADNDLDATQQTLATLKSDNKKLLLHVELTQKLRDMDAKRLAKETRLKTELEAMLFKILKKDNTQLLMHLKSQFVSLSARYDELEALAA